MKKTLTLLRTLGTLAISTPAFAQAATSPDDTAPRAATEAAAAAEAEMAELEAAFRARLTQATFKGRWALIQDGELGPERAETYRINSVTKLAGDLWIITARIQYANQDITAPVPVRVRWAGDTPVIMVNDVPIPGSGSYSARVMIYGDTYAGSWTGGKHGGLMNGVIQRSTADPEDGE
jgi:hypothetical protein